MTETGFKVQTRCLIAGLVGGLFAGLSSGVLAFVLLEIGEVTGTLIKVLLIGSGILGVLYGITDYQGVRNSTWIALLVAFRIFIVWLGGLTAFAIREALEVEGTWRMMAMPIGTLAGIWIGRIVNSRILLPKVAGDVNRSG